MPGGGEGRILNKLGSNYNISNSLRALRRLKRIGRK
jgi:hypothetical protein